MGAGRPRLVRPGTGARRDGVRRGGPARGDRLPGDPDGGEGRRSAGRRLPPGRGVGRLPAGPGDHPPREPRGLGAPDPGRGPDARRCLALPGCPGEGSLWARPRCPGSRGDARACRRRPREGGGRFAGSRPGGRGRPSRHGRPCLRGHVHVDRGEPRDAGRQRERGDVPRVRRKRPEPVCPSTSVPRQRGRGPLLLPRPRRPYRLSFRVGRRFGSAPRRRLRGGEAAWVGRAKVERRPLVLVRAVGPSGNEHSIVLQNAETIRLVGPGGATPSIARIAAGDEVLLMEERAGRHFGVAVEETIREK